MEATQGHLRQALHPLGPESLGQLLELLQVHHPAAPSQRR